MKPVGFWPIKNLTSPLSVVLVNEHRPMLQAGAQTTTELVWQRLK
jgi:hypothetical protein